MAICSGCGYDAGTMKFCPECGNRMTSVAPPPPPPPQSRQGRPASSSASRKSDPQAPPRKMRPSSAPAPPPPPPPPPRRSSLKSTVPSPATGEEAQALYKSIIKKVRASSGGDDQIVQSFKSDCKLYGQGNLPAAEFYQNLVNSIGEEETEDLFPELVRLIPDEEKRAALLEESITRQKPKKSVQSRTSFSSLRNSFSSKRLDSKNYDDGGRPSSRLSTKGHYQDHPTCDVCNANFDLMGKRRHQCRMCASFVCAGCSPVFLLIPPGQQADGVKGYDPAVPQRVCTVCAPLLHEHQDSLRATYAASEKDNPHDAKLRLHIPYSRSLEQECRDAADIIGNFFRQELGSNVDRKIPVSFLKRANGLAIMKIVKAGFIVSGKLGTGLVISKLPDGSWSAPSAIGTAGLSWGLMVGGEIVELLIILGSEAAVKVFHRTQVNVGGGLDVAVGPVGRSASGGASVGRGGLGVNYSYSHARGLYAGISLDGAVIMTRGDVNRKFYGQDLEPADLLSGRVDSPRAAQPLYDALAAAEEGIEDFQDERRRAREAKALCSICECDNYVESSLPFDNKCKLCKHKH